MKIANEIMKADGMIPSHHHQLWVTRMTMGRSISPARELYIAQEMLSCMSINSIKRECY